jgi:hypothetical protein
MMMRMGTCPESAIGSVDPSDTSQEDPKPRGRNYQKNTTSEQS